MTATKNGTIYKAIIAMLVFVSSIITASWAIEDRINKKIEAARQEYAIDSMCIREMQETLARIEERQKYILKQLDDKNR